MIIRIGDQRVEVAEISSLLSNHETLNDLSEVSAESLFRGSFVEGAIEINEPDNIQFTSGLEIEVVNKNNPHPPADFHFGEDSASKPDRKPWDRQNQPAVIYRTRARVTGGASWTGSSFLGGGLASFRGGLKAGSEITFSHICIHNRDTTVSAAIQKDLFSDVEKGFLFAGAAGNLFKLTPDREYLVTNFESALEFSFNLTWGQVFSGNPGFLKTFHPANGEIDSLTSLDLRAVGSVAVDAFVRARMEMIASLTEDSGRTLAAIEFRKASGNQFSLGAAAKISCRVRNPSSVTSALESLVSGTLGGILAVHSNWLDDTVIKIRAARKALGFSDLLTQMDFEIREKVAGILDSWEEQLGAKLPDLIGLKDRIDRMDEWFSQTAPLFTEADSLTSALLSKIPRISLVPPEALEAALHRERYSAILDLFPDLSAGTLAALLSIPEYTETLATSIVGDTASSLAELQSEILSVIRLQAREVLDDAEEKFLGALSRTSGLDPAQVIATIASRQNLAAALDGKAGEFLDQILTTIDSLPLDAGLGALEDLAQRFSAQLQIPLLRLPERVGQLTDQLILGLERGATLIAEVEFSREKRTSRFLEFHCDYSAREDGRERLSELYRALLRGNLNPVIQASLPPAEPNFIKTIDFFAAEELTRRFRLNFSLNKLTQEQEGRSTRRESFKKPRLREDFLLEEARFLGRQRVDLETGNWSAGYEVIGGLLLSATSRTFVDESDTGTNALRYDLTFALKWEGGFLENPFPNSRFIRFMADLIDSTGMVGFNLSEKLTDLLREAIAGESVWASFEVRAGDQSVRRLWRASPTERWRKETGESVSMIRDYDTAIVALEEFRERFRRSIGASAANSATSAANRNQYFDDLAELAAVARSGTRDQLDKRLRKWRREVNATGSIPGKIEKYAILASLLKALARDKAGDWSLSGSLGIRRPNHSTREIRF